MIATQEWHGNSIDSTGEKAVKLRIWFVGAGPQHPLPGGGAVQQGELRRRVHQQLRLGRDPGGEMKMSQAASRAAVPPWCHCSLWNEGVKAAVLARHDILCVIA